MSDTTRVPHIFRVRIHTVVDPGGFVSMFFIHTLYQDHVIGVLVSGQYLTPDLLNKQAFHLSEQAAVYLKNLLSYYRIAPSPTVLTKPPGSTTVQQQYLHAWISALLCGATSNYLRSLPNLCA
jgi:hypothetical protein